ncbi:protein of unknown function [Latilactobacillus sakei]|nr:protein of unknown function [Latilactobacillus sakei]
MKSRTTYFYVYSNKPFYIAILNKIAYNQRHSLEEITVK